MPIRLTHRLLPALALLTAVAATQPAVLAAPPAHVAAAIAPPAVTAPGGLLQDVWSWLGKILPQNSCGLDPNGNTRCTPDSGH